MSPKKDCLVLASREKGWRENSRAGRNNLTDVWRVCGLLWDDRAGKSSPTRTTFGVTGVLFEPVSLSIQKKWFEPLSNGKGWSTNLHSAMKNAQPPFNQRMPYSKEYMSCTDLPMWLGGFWMFTQRQQQNIYKESKQTLQWGSQRSLGAGLRGKRRSRWKDVNSSHST